MKSGCLEETFGLRQTYLKTYADIYTADSHFYRHPETDFIIAYDRQPPFDLDEYTYLLCHPQNMLLSKHKIILLSKSSKPNGRVKKTKKIKPPKLMLTKWFFQKQFAEYPLLQLKASAANFQYSHLGCCNTNQITTFFI